MIPACYFAFAAALFSSLLGIAVVARRRRSVAGCCFFAGMLLLAGEALLDGLSVKSPTAPDIAQYQMFALLVSSLMPSAWLCFSLTYSRGNYREFLHKWRFALAAALLLPAGLALGFRGGLFHFVPPSDDRLSWWLGFTIAGKALNVLLLIANVLVLVTIENTFRAAVGTMRWRIKFVVLGLAVIFGVRIYTRSQALLFSGQSLDITGLETAALLIGCTFIAIAYLRTGMVEIDVYPSHAILQSSVTILLAGAYLFIVGVMAQVIGYVGGAESFHLHAFVVLLGIAALGVLLLSDKFRQATHLFVSRHFKRPQHDFRKVWTDFTQRTSNVIDKVQLCDASSRLISETFNVLGVTIWLFDENRQRLAFVASTAQLQHGEATSADCALIRGGLSLRAGPFDLEKVKEDWAQPLKQLTSTQFRTGGNRFCLPLFVGSQWLGVIILADRVNGIPYTVEELDLLKCLADQLASSLLNLKLTGELMVAKELEAFQTMATFFVHDLKNAASSLNLMLRNLPVHFDDPAFRADALRGIGSTSERIQQMIGRLSVLRDKLEPRPVEIDLQDLVRDTLAGLKGMPPVEILPEPCPRILADPDQLRSVLTNLLLNAADAAAGPAARVSVATSQQNGHAILSVSDNGCGMSPDFLKHSLFRPFQTTKKRGLGIGMFQSRMIVEAHQGRIEVESEPGAGTTFHVKLPFHLKTRTPAQSPSEPPSRPIQP
jgi:putative PEP-CTERM system histidine kinase